MATFTYDDLIDWSTGLPEWQRDALRRVLERGELTAADVEELAGLAKQAHLKDSPVTSSAVVASAEHVRPTSDVLAAVRLLGVRDIDRVNALGPGPIPFVAEGLTLIYGANASGKSGVARILKKACRARDPEGPIRPNVFEPEPSEPATATLDYQVGEESASHVWSDGAESVAELRTINVFDSRCAAVQVERANQLSYTPAILDVFRALAAATDQVAGYLRDEKNALGSRPRVLDELNLPVDTPAAKLVASLSPDTKSEAITSLCRVTDDDRARLAELERALADDPARKADTEEARLRRLDQLTDVVEQADTLVGDTC